MWDQPPCTLYEKLVVDRGFKHVRIVQGGETGHPCGFDKVAGKPVQPWFTSMAQRHQGVQVVVNEADTTHGPSDAFLRDACIMLSAAHLVVSFSTFSQSLAVLSRRVQHVYVGSDGLGLLREACSESRGGLAGVGLHFYDTGHDGRNHSRAGVLDYFWNYPMQKIHLEHEC